MTVETHPVQVDGFGTINVCALGREEVQACCEQADDPEHFSLLLVDRAVNDGQFENLTVAEVAAVLAEYPNAFEQMLAAVVEHAWKPEVEI